MQGPESAPLREYVKNYAIVVNIYSGDDLIRHENVDYGDFEQKKWLGRLSFWAWTCGYTVETLSKEMHEQELMKEALGLKNK